MEPVDGLTAMKMILGSFPEAKIIVVTEHRDLRIREISLEKGASAFVGKDDVTALAKIVQEVFER
jgi:DNA-binding NarL/FixJ family response regulator